MSVLLFLAVLFVLILVHEWGHFIVAKKTGMRVDEFGIGFPPKIKGIKKGETEYTFNWLPIGGFVRIWGENYEEAEGARDTEDFSRSFTAKPKWAQALVLVAGVTMNVLFAWLLFAITLMIGVPTAVDESVASDSSELYVAAVLPDSPAEVLPAGAVVNSVSFNDYKVESPTPTEFSDTVQQAEGNPVTVSYTYDSSVETVEIVAEQGLIEEDPERYVVGASLSLVEIEKLSFFSAFVEGAKATWNGLKAITIGLSTLLAEAVVGEADFSNIAGPVGIVSLVGDAASYGITSLLTFTAIISLNLAVINLLPFPALDGGRLLFVFIEAVIRKPIPSVWAGRVNLLGFALLMLLMIAVTYNDIIRLL